MKGNTTFGFLLGALVIGSIAGVLHYKSTPSPISKPEITFEAPKKNILECEDAGPTANGNTTMRCTDKERDVTCYIIRPGAATPTVSCLPNQWLNYPQSIANVNDPIQLEK